MDMSEGVVDVLETIQIQEQHRDLVLIAAGQSKSPGQAGRLATIGWANR